MTEQNSGIDESKPSIARVYDYLLGGRENFPVDREIGDYFIRDLPGSSVMALINRRALVRAVGAMSDEGIRQFIDLGSGLPTADNVHQVAQRHDPATHVVYVDNDPTVLTHGRALLDADERTALIEADLGEPQTVHDHPDVRRLIDFDRPVGLLFSAILHHFNDADRPADLVRWWADRLPPGSLVYLSHFRSAPNPGADEAVRLAEQKLQSSFGRGHWRTDEEILALFGDLELLEPGLVPCPLWRPGAGDAASAAGDARPVADEVDLTVWERLISCGLARKP
ncbi:SAM-dependent methyltransferase [Kitasatospora sp. NPDC089797]|uniref:SAM-dependent methyltransferase n=1 Tax=Kitasatospora sp. NPDC089797 TaxID=3155298 RepID=UPI003425A507